MSNILERRGRILESESEILERLEPDISPPTPQSWHLHVSTYLASVASRTTSPCRTASSCRTTSSGKAWFWSSTKRQYFLVFSAFWVFLLWVLHICLVIYFCFLIVFQVRWACELLSNRWFVEKLAWASYNVSVNLGDDGTKFLPVWRILPTVLVFTHGIQQGLLCTSGLY